MGNLTTRHKLVGTEVYVSAPFTGSATPKKVIITKYDKKAKQYLVENLKGEELFIAWVDDIYNKDGEPIYE